MIYRVYMSGRGLIHKSTKQLPSKNSPSPTETLFCHKIVEEHCRIVIFMSGNYNLNLIETFTLLIF